MPCACNISKDNFKICSAIIVIVSDRTMVQIARRSQQSQNTIKKMIKLRYVLISIAIVVYLWTLTVKRMATVVVPLKEEGGQRVALNLPQHDEERYAEVDGFKGSPILTIIRLGSCECDLISRDCLDVMNCLTSSTDDPLRNIYAGIVMRETIKERAKFWSSSLITNGRGSAIGMASQEVAILVWKEWLSRNEIPKGLLSEVEPFVDGTRYPFCREQKLEGRACFLNRFAAQEAYGMDIEKPAAKKYDSKANADAFKEASTKLLSALQSNPYNTPRVDYLITFAHVSRITFNLRSRFIASIYEKRLKTIDHNVDNKEVYRVALHVRRGDACLHETTHYLDDPSFVESPAQATGYRMCYTNLVYTDAITRLTMMLPDRHIVVYMATDHSGSLLDEIKEENDHIYSSVSWKYLDYPPSTFRSDDNALIGEASLMNIYHLSHGQSFVGHMGSRFSKMSWWQATARHNNFIPYFSVDGHSVCCNIDEPCGAMAPFIVSMENCLAIDWPESKYYENLKAEEYWQKGLLIRQEAAREEREFREQYVPKYKLASKHTEEVNAPDMILTPRATEEENQKEREKNNESDAEEQPQSQPESQPDPEPQDEEPNDESKSTENEKVEEDPQVEPVQQTKPEPEDEPAQENSSEIKEVENNNEGKEENTNEENNSEEKKEDNDNGEKKEENDRRGGKEENNSGEKKEDSDNEEKKEENNSEDKKEEGRNGQNEEELKTVFIGSPASTFFSDGDCECDLISIDCLDWLNCLPSTEASGQQEYTGVVTRKAIKNLANFWDFPLGDIMHHSPIGMGTQAVAIEVWQMFLSKNEIPSGLVNEPCHFVNETMYPYCQNNGLIGKNCLINEFTAEEEYGDIELEAIKRNQGKDDQKIEEFEKNRLRTLQSNPFNATTMDYLLAFSQLSRVTFNLRSHVQEIYKQRLTTINHRNGNSTGKELLLSLHIRRGDACGSENSEYADDISRLDSPAQFSNKRLCYQTSVYMDAVLRVIKMDTDRHVVVYVATDDSKSIMEEIKNSFSEVYESASWKYVDYSRDIFNYFRKDDVEMTFIESPENTHKGMLGETAVIDIWHLSHGQAFVGHLGSRFGKLAWWQATARRNSFVPFFTVDGHSVCCEIDENCGAMAKFIPSMESCLSIFWPQSKYRNTVDLKEYWEKGSTIRVEASHDERAFRKERKIELGESTEEIEQVFPPHEFAGSPASTLIKVGDCQCELVSIDCLDSIRCIPDDSLKLVYDGVATRKVANQLASHKDDTMAESLADSPIGMASQYVATAVWNTWLTKNEFAKGLAIDPDAFVNETRYDFCVENHLQGRRCFINDFNAAEEYGDIELEAIAKYESTQIDAERLATRQLQALQQNPMNVTSLEYLISYAHISRMTLNFRAHIHAIYAQHLKTIDHQTNSTESRVFRVSMHFRRGDACRHETEGYEKEASPLDSPAQFSMERKCYDTSVYIAALRRILELVPNQHVVVYLSTDHSGSLMEEIKTDYADIYQIVSWKYLEYPREVFNYFGGKHDDGSYIESPRNKNKAILGETAVADIWHLSHGRAFIGHLGSRFGKLGWLQATGRYNSFIPFYTVDGHSVCCDIDEACGVMAKYVVSMENCHATFWPRSRYTVNLDLEEYFTSGSYFRRDAAKDELSFRESGVQPHPAVDDEEIDEPFAFVGSPSSTMVEIKDCDCQLVSIDCLDAVRCIPTDPMQQIHSGIVIRTMLKKLAIISDDSIGDTMPDSPVGKASQHLAIRVWREWLSRNELPKGLGNVPDAFLNGTLYQHCLENNLQGRRCFIGDFADDETYGDMEIEAIDRFKETLSDEEAGATARLQSLQSNPFNASTMEYLLMHAQVSHISLNLRPHVHELYKQHLTTIDHVDANATGDILRVAMHFRRGDACMHAITGYEKNASALDSRAQMGMERMCYETSVYMNSLRRILKMLPGRHVVVYLATDHSRSLIEEIKTNYADVFLLVSWKYLQYSREVFDYFGGEADSGNFIESPDNKHRAILGETALLDIWHLSHGQVFIGHLGSRFGKLSWIQATARYNTFIPFFTVDGHSVCCDIDEACGKYAKHVVSMENCLSIYWPESKYTKNLDLDEYFSTGAYFRKEAAKEELIFREEREVEIGLALRSKLESMIETVNATEDSAEEEVEDPFRPFDKFIGSPASTLIETGDCQCQLVSIDCLDTIRCLAADPTEEIHTGIVTRSVTKQLVVVQDEPMGDVMPDAPVGKASQFLAIKVWRRWLAKNEIPKGLINRPDAFLNGTLYSHCRDNDLNGRGCFIDDFDSEEAYGSMEKQAIEKFKGNRSEEETLAKKRLQSLQNDPFSATALEYLLMHAQISRISLNLRPHVHELYQQHVTTIDHSSKTANTTTGGILRVGMHLRRGDACRHETTGYELNASPLDSPAQVSGERLCYDTTVYLDALKRIQDLAPDRHIIVHVATDHSGSLLEEIKTNYTAVYESVSWKYLEYSREIFDYFGGKANGGTYIESPDNQNRAILGETGLLDIWHLSHGQVFIGHLGSRFGKFSWIQAVGRHNALVPFFTVDGHSVCCDIDEACGVHAKEVVSMENCIGMYWPESKWGEQNFDPKIYYGTGAFFRTKAAADEKRFREKKMKKDVAAVA